MVCDKCQHIIKPITDMIHQEINRLVVKNCFGCQFDRPGQTEHDKCLMLDSTEKLEEFFHEAWENLRVHNGLKFIIYKQLEVSFTLNMIFTGFYK